MLLRFLLALILLLSLPASAFAYSYGDPNKEEIAEAYKEIAAKLEKSPEDWDGAFQVFAAKKKEIALEFGDQVVNALEAGFAQKQKELVLHNYKAVLVLNVNRRLTNAENQFDDYAKAKLLLAKGRGTFNVLSPYADSGTSAKVYGAFDAALAALGNPGLFGVGTVPADKSEFLKQTKAIRSLLAPLYQLKAPSVTKPAAKPQQTQAQPAAQPAKPAQTPKQPTGQAAASSPNNQAQSTAVPSSGAQTKSGADVNGNAAVQPDGPNTLTNAAAAAESSAPSGTAADSSKPTAAGSVEGKTFQAASSTDNQTVQAEGADAANEPHAATAAQSSGAEASASKVNPLVTVSVIAGLVLAIGGAFWLGKRKGLI